MQLALSTHLQHWICLHTVVQSVTNTAYSDKKIVDGYQTELPDSWLDNGNAWEIARPEETVEVKFGGEVYTDWVDGKFTCRYNNSHTIFGYAL